MQKKNNGSQEIEITEEIEKFVKEVSDFFNKEMVEIGARKTKFVQRKSKLTGHLFLSIFTFAMSIYGTPTLEQLIGLLKIIEPNLDITRQGLQDRINEKAVKFFEHMLSLSIKINIPDTFNLNTLEFFERVLIHDSTSFQLPDELAEFFKGSGGSASAAAVKIQFCYDLKSCQFFYILQDGTSPDNRYDNSFINEIKPNDLIIRDLGYSNTEGFIDMANQTIYFLSRAKSDLSLYKKDEDGEFVKLDIVKILKETRSNFFELNVYIKKGHKFTKVRLVIERVPDAVKNTRLRNINKNNKKKGRKTSKKTKILQGFNLYISNIPKEIVNLNEEEYHKLMEKFPHAKEILEPVIRENEGRFFIDISRLSACEQRSLGSEVWQFLTSHTEDIVPAKYFRLLYSIRWQIELVFKNWKSNFSLAQVTGQRQERIKCMIYAKLLFIFISSKFIFAAKSYLWRVAKKEVSEDRASKHLIIIAHEWLRLLFADTEELVKLLKNAFKFIMKHSVKIPQKDRIYPLQLIERITNKEL